MNNDLRRLPLLVQLSRETRNIINPKFVIGLAFVLGGVTLGALNFITFVVAAIFHVAGSLLVVFNSFRLMRTGEELEPHQAAAPGPAQTETGAVALQLQPAHL